MDFALLFISMSLSSIGSLLDNYTTLTFIRDIGVEFEANKRARNAIIEHGYRTELLYEAGVIILIGVVDSLNLFYPYCFWGLVILTARGLVAAYNLQNIVLYRAIGTDAFKERVRSRTQAFQHISLMNRIEYILPYLAEASICFVIYGILLTIDFSLVILSRYLVLSLAVYLIIRAIYSSRKE